MKSVVSPTKCHPLLLIVSFLLSFEIAGTGKNVCTERWLLIRTAHIQGRNIGKNARR